MILSKFFSKVFLLILLSFLLNECGFYRKTDARKVPTNAKERVKKNIEEGKSVQLGKLGKGGGSGNFEFASSNEMWRATIEILDFVPLISADYGGGIIISDWYNNGNNNQNSLKIMVQFLSNEVRADGIKIIVYDKICNDVTLNNCKTEINESNISQDIKLAILKKASIMKNTKTKTAVDKYRKERPILNKKIRPN
jgi:hypothetical protein